MDGLRRLCHMILLHNFHLTMSLEPLLSIRNCIPKFLPHSIHLIVAYYHLPLYKYFLGPPDSHPFPSRSADTRHEQDGSIARQSQVKYSRAQILTTHPTTRRSSASPKTRSADSPKSEFHEQQRQMKVCFRKLMDWSRKRMAWADTERKSTWE